MKFTKKFLAMFLVGLVGITSVGVLAGFTYGYADEPAEKVAVPVPGTDNAPEMVVSGDGGLGMPVPDGESAPEMIALGGEGSEVPAPLWDCELIPDSVAESLAG